MVFVIVSVVLCNILLHSDCAAVKENQVTIKFPTLVMDRSSVIIKGTLNVGAPKLRATIAGRELGKEEECIIDLKPRGDTIIINNEEIYYSFSYQNQDIIQFEFAITATCNEEAHLMHVGFEGNNQGRADIDSPCNFTSLYYVDVIHLEGFKHIQNLTFLYEEDGGMCRT